MDSLSQVDSEVVTAAEAAMQAALHPSVFNHSMRVLHLARHLSPHQTVPDHEALAVAALFHDSGTAQENSGEQRFEVEGRCCGTVPGAGGLPCAHGPNRRNCI